MAKPSPAEYRELENGVADALAFLAGDGVVVDRNAYLLGGLSRARRQVDVLVRGDILGRTNAVLVVDCKRGPRG